MVWFSHHFYWLPRKAVCPVKKANSLLSLSQEESTAFVFLSFLSLSATVLAFVSLRPIVSLPLHHSADFGFSTGDDLLTCLSRSRFVDYSNRLFEQTVPSGPPSLTAVRG
jgi:hypothetical protein